MLRRQKHVLSQSTTPFACILAKPFPCSLSVLCLCMAREEGQLYSRLSFALCVAHVRDCLLHFVLLMFEIVFCTLCCSCSRLSFALCVAHVRDCLLHFVLLMFEIGSTMPTGFLIINDEQQKRLNTRPWVVNLSSLSFHQTPS